MNAELREWVAANPRAPAPWRALAVRLAHYHEAGALWAQVQPLGATPLQIMALARDALARSTDEVQRPSESDEDRALDRVGKKLAELREAIERSPLLRDPAAMRGITGPGLPEVLLALSWSPRSEVDGFPAYRGSIVEFLAVAREMLDTHRARRAPRAVLRHRDRPATAAFVRWADWLMCRAFGERPPAALAHLANAALDLADPIGPDDVRAILKDSPEAFTAPT